MSSLVEAEYIKKVLEGVVCSLRNDEIAKDEVLASTKSTSDGYDEKYETVQQTCATPDIYSTELIIKLGKK